MDQILALQEERTQHVHFDQITMDELISAQLHDVFCADVCRRLNEGNGVPFEIKKEGLLVRTATAVQQIGTPHALKKRVLWLNHNPTLAGHPGGRKLYARVRRHFYWPALTTDCYATVRNCPECARNRIKLRQNVGELTLFPATAPLKSVCTYIIGELVRMPRENWYVLFIVDRFNNLVRTVPLNSIHASEVARTCVTYFVFAFDHPTQLIDENSNKFSS